MAEGERGSQGEVMAAEGVRDGTGFGGWLSGAGELREVGLAGWVSIAANCTRSCEIDERLAQGDLLYSPVLRKDWG